MDVRVFSEADQAIPAAAEILVSWLLAPDTRAVMLAGGNTPLPLYAAVAEKLGPAPASLRVFVLDEYVGVPLEHPGTCTNLLGRSARAAWGVAEGRFFGLSSREDDALARVVAHEDSIESSGGLHAIVLGLGANGHLGFNEPGSTRESGARLVSLDRVSVEANRAWFGGEHAPAVGATVGLRTILAARRVMLLAFGARKAEAVRAMVGGPLGAACPASFLQEHPAALVFLDEAAAGKLHTP